MSAANSSVPGTPDPELTEDFKAAMRLLAASVTVITSGKGEARRGLTATAVCSLSMTPPSMLVCVNRFGEAHSVITQTGAFCVNILADDNEEIARRFAGQGGTTGVDKFENADWTELETGSPTLDSALVNIDCELSETTHTESHSVFFGVVRKVRLAPSKRPLLHFNRTFFSLPDQGGI
jgi:flavin reductase (DIM6/NTAB) family NADH-FMN oxidoreductase RutF